MSSPSIRMSPRLIPIRNSIRRPSGTPSFLWAIAACTATAHSTASKRAVLLPLLARRHSVGAGRELAGISDMPRPPRREPREGFSQRTAAHSLHRANPAVRDCHDRPARPHHLEPSRRRPELEQPGVGSPDAGRPPGAHRRRQKQPPPGIRTDGGAQVDGVRLAGLGGGR
jgi:hypothetical protein